MRIAAHDLEHKLLCERGDSHVVFRDGRAACFEVVSNRSVQVRSLAIGTEDKRICFQLTKQRLRRPGVFASPQVRPLYHHATSDNCRSGGRHNGHESTAAFVPPRLGEAAPTDVDLGHKWLAIGNLRCNQRATIGNRLLVIETQPAP